MLDCTMPDFDHLDWKALDRLRAAFLGEASARATPYWQNHDTLAAYDATYAERIGWKWDALLSELSLRAWTPPAGTVLVDWGCGSGVAGRRVLAAFGAAHFSGLHLHDHASEAVAFASVRARETFPSLPLLDSPGFRLSAAPFTLVVSHVLNVSEVQAHQRHQHAAAHAAVRAAREVRSEPPPLERVAIREIQLVTRRRAQNSNRAIRAPHHCQ
jgi:hypothetical protein